MASFSAARATVNSLACNALTLFGLHFVLGILRLPRWSSSEEKREAYVSVPVGVGLLKEGGRSI
jgi:hypothetical protein